MGTDLHERLEVWPGAGIYAVPAENPHVTRIDFADGESAFMFTGPLVLQDEAGEHFEVRVDEIGGAVWTP